MVTAVDIDPVFDCGRDCGPVVSSNCIEEFLGDANVGLFRPFAVIDRVEAARDTLASRVLNNEPSNSSSN